MSNNIIRLNGLILQSLFFRLLYLCNEFVVKVHYDLTGDVNDFASLRLKCLLKNQ